MSMTRRAIAIAAVIRSGFFYRRLQAQAQTDIQWWHSMTAVNGEWVNDLAKEFNASQKEYRSRAHLQGHATTSP